MSMPIIRSVDSYAVARIRIHGEKKPTTGFLSFRTFEDARSAANELNWRTAVVSRKKPGKGWSFVRWTDSPIEVKPGDVADGAEECTMERFAKETEELMKQVLKDCDAERITDFIVDRHRLLKEIRRSTEDEMVLTVNGGWFGTVRRHTTSYLNVNDGNEYEIAVLRP